MAATALETRLKAKDPNNPDIKPADDRTQRVAQKRYEVALRALERDSKRGAELLQRLIDDLPNTDAAKQAVAKLQELADAEDEES